MPLRAIVRLGWLCIVPLSCAAPRELALPAPAKIFEVLTAPSTAFPVDSSDLIAPFDAQWTWQLVDANGRAIKDPAIQTLASSTALYGATWMVPMIDGDREFLSQGKDDEISLVAVEAPHDQAISYFTPPLILAPSQMHLEDLFASSSSMRVDWMDGRGERDRGIGERTARVVRGERIRTPLGEFETMRVETKFEATLRFAKAQRTNTLWVAAGIGVIAEEWRGRVTVMGIPISNDVGTAVRISPITTTKRVSVP